MYIGKESLSAHIFEGIKRWRLLNPFFMVTRLSGELSSCNLNHIF